MNTATILTQNINLNSNLSNLPSEMRALKQWVVAINKVPHYWDNVDVIRASVTDPNTWMSYDHAVSLANHYGYQMGFVISSSDPFCCIDLDVKDDTDPRHIENFHKIIGDCDSYTERSISGKGFHIWVKANIGAGCKKHGVEVYSQERFMVCTGDVYLDKPIRERKDYVYQLGESLRGNEGKHMCSPIPDQAQTELDEVILDKARKASNAAKFNLLFEGHWRSLPEYPSQSEADSALLGMLTFYSPNNTQCKRLFRQSKLGKRDKAIKNDDYLDRTINTVRQGQANNETPPEYFEWTNAFIKKILAEYDAKQEALRNECLTVRDLSEVKMRAITWVWEGWIPKGYLTIWAGESGAGKTTVLTDIVARETTGNPWPGDSEHRKPGRVLWLGSEDGMAELTVPRLNACGANLKNVQEIIPNKNGDSFSLQDDLRGLENSLKLAKSEDRPYTIMVIDPITSYLQGKKGRQVDMNQSGDLRPILEPVFRLANEYHLAVVCVTHFSKDTSRKMFHRVLGSGAFVQTCRSLVAIVSMENEDDKYSKAMIQIKNNLPESPTGAWRFQTVNKQVGVCEHTGKVINATMPEWIELDERLTAGNYLLEEKKKRGPASEYFPIFDGVIKRLFACGIPLPEAQVREECLAAGVSQSWWTLNHTKHLNKPKKGYCFPITP